MTGAGRLGCGCWAAGLRVLGGKWLAVAAGLRSSGDEHGPAGGTAAAAPVQTGTRAGAAAAAAGGH